MDTTSDDIAKSAAAQQKTKGIGATLGNKVDELGRSARQMLDSGSDQVKQGIDSLKGTVQDAREKVSSSGDAVITYTRDNPVKALMFAAVSGAVLWTLIKAVAHSRD